MNAPVPPGFRQPPVLEAFAWLADENVTLFDTLQQIANTDSRHGLQMKELAADIVNQILEKRIDRKVKETAQ